MISRVNIIGLGNVGSHLSQVLSEQLVSTASRSASHKIEDLNEDVDLNIIAAPDDAIADITVQLPRHIPVVHTSGSVPMEVLSEFEVHGILYPLQTFSKGHVIDLTEVPFLLETNTSSFFSELEDFCHSFLSKHTYQMDSSERAVIHLAAVFANNFTTLMLHEAEQVLAKADFNIDILEPLMQETIKKAFRLGPKQALTGPAKRGDVNIMSQHIDRLEDPKVKEIYRLLSERIQKL